ncbi:MAG: hypothetical protein U0836_16560 [Pirellulales bacterium]
MSWISRALDAVATAPDWGYYPGQAAAAEPTAWAALALVCHDHPAAARPLQALLAAQAPDGGLPVVAGQTDPRWPTSLAVAAWRTAASRGLPEKLAYEQAAARGLARLGEIAGTSMPRIAHLGHDSTLVGWPWAEGTHSWSDPTALALVAFKVSGQGAAPRASEAARLLIDRLLPEGGCNYGNTTVLGQLLRPHVEPSGWAALALVGETDPSGRLERTCGYLRREAPQQTTALSLSAALLGLAAQDAALPGPEAQRVLSAAAERVLVRDRSLWKLALLTLAAAGPRSAFLELLRNGQAHA